MLYFFTYATTEEYLQIKTAISKNKEIDLFFDDISFDLSSLQNTLSGNSLFEQRDISILPKNIILKECLSGGKGESLWSFLREEGFASTEAEIFIFEKEYTADQKAWIDKNKDRAILNTGLEKKPKKNTPSPFAFTDVLGTMQKRLIWLAYCDAKRELSDEDLVPACIWYLKTLVLVKRNDTKDISPFVLQKMKRIEKNTSEKKIFSLYQSLVHVYHDARRPQATPLPVLFEEWILRSF